MSADSSRHGPADLLSLRMPPSFRHECWYRLIKRSSKLPVSRIDYASAADMTGLQDEVGSTPHLQIPVREHFAGLVKFIEQRYAGRNVEFQNLFL